MRDLTILSGLTAVVEDAAPASRPPILFIHGTFAGAWQFEELQRYFAALGYPSHAINLRGHHGSRPVPDLGRVSVLDYVDDALPVARALGRPIVVGHSMGGLVAQKLAEAGVTSAAVLLCAAPPKGISIFSPSLFVKQLKHAREILLSHPIMPDARDINDLAFNRIPPAERPALLARLVPESGRAGREMSFGAIAVDEQKVRCPVLSISAEDDRFVVARVGRQIARKYRADHLHFTGHGHFITGEPGWEAVAAEVARWLERRVGNADQNR
jgi:non-heme chloroperoxidase